MKFINIHTHQNCILNNTIAILNCYPNSTNITSNFSIGIHPWYIKKEQVTKELLLIKKQALLKNCFAIGECGLDKLCDVDFELQQIVFKKQIAISEAIKKPLIIHCVKAHQEVIQLKKELKPTQPWIIHGFNKNKQLAGSLLKNGCYLSYGKALTKSPKTQDAFLATPLKQLFLETDNTNDNIADIYQKAAEIKEIKTEKLQEIIYQNFNNIFTQ